MDLFKSFQLYKWYQIAQRITYIGTNFRKLLHTKKVFTLYNLNAIDVTYNDSSV